MYIFVNNALIYIGISAVVCMDLNVMLKYTMCIYYAIYVMNKNPAKIWNSCRFVNALS